MEVKNVSGSQVVKNSFWKFCESIGVQLIHLIVTLILARLLGPNDYGLMALVFVAVNFVSLFINSSIASYLVYITNITKSDFFTCLVVNLTVALLLVLCLFTTAPYISEFYAREELTSLLRVMSVIIPFSSISSVYNAYAVKMSLHKKLFLRNIISIPISGVVALTMAYSGFGVWSLIAQQIVYNVLLATIIVITIKITIDGTWRFDKHILKPMFAYGGTNLLTTFIGFISDNINDLLIGKKIDSVNLGYYNRGNTFPGVLANVLNNLASNVFFPAFSSYKDDISDLKAKFRKSITILYYICFPMFLGMSVCSEAFVNAVLTEKWFGAIPVIQLTCIYYCAIPFLQICSQVFLALGKLKIRAVGEIVKMVLTILLLFAVIDYGITAVAFARVILAVCLVLFTCAISYHYFKYTFTEFLRDILPPFCMALVMAGAIYFITYLGLSALSTLILQVLLGVIVYVVLLKLLRSQEFELIISIIKRRR